MGKIIIKEPGKKEKFIKTYDKVNQCIEFTTDVDEAYDRTDGSWYTRAEIQSLKFYFKKEFPELEYAEEYDY
jgi:hypothetical protein